MNLKFEQNKSVYQDNKVISTKASYDYDFVGIWDARFAFFRNNFHGVGETRDDDLRRHYQSNYSCFPLFFSKDNTQGINCEKCKEYFYRSPGRNQSDVDACQGNERKHGL